ncbi:MAG: hypothetical protein MN733_01890 [Nitrososphaera sp.]|nr:hypothetical protein [Nitrososphaera sp.]
MKFIRDTIAFLLYAVSLTAFAAPDYETLNWSSKGMSQNQMRAVFGEPDYPDPQFRSDGGVWFYRNVIHPVSGNPKSCMVSFNSDLEVTRVNCGD